MADEVDIYSKVEAVSTRVMIFGAPNDTPSVEDTQVDEIDADAYETFTLEEMRKLIISYRKKNNDFIIARVTTPDPGDQSVFYNFYYSAAEINRILFRISRNRKSLHRMKVKNPLNNMYIVGQVFYYKISIENIDKAIVNYFFSSDKEKKRIKRAFSAVFSKSNLSYSENSLNERSKDCSYIPNPKLNISKDSERPYQEIIENMKQGAIKIPFNIPNDKKIKYYAKYFANDEDFLVKAEIRRYFEQNALEKDDEFLYELDRTRNDFMALLDDDSDEYDEDVSSWRRVFSAHVTLAISILIICFFLTGGLITLIILPIAIILFFSFLISLVYVLCCRRTTFDSIAVNEINTNYDHDSI